MDSDFASLVPALDDPNAALAASAKRLIVVFVDEGYAILATPTQ